MSSEDHSPTYDATRLSISPLPIALYESKGLIFELYQGGQPDRSYVIRWERLKVVTVTRQQRDYDVQISQRKHE